MKKISLTIFAMCSVMAFFTACKEENVSIPEDLNAIVQSYLNIDLNDLPAYSSFELPVHYNNIPTNTPINNSITDGGATLGRVLFYDKALSIDNSVSCASCHAQDMGFTDSAKLSEGFDGGQTGAHSMRLANAAFYQGISFFWDKRAATLEEQTTMPIQDAVEMGFDADHGGMDSLFRKMSALEYYPILFDVAFGDDQISEERMQFAMAQFIRSMVSTNSKFDEGFEQAFNPNAPGPGAGIGQPFVNYTAQENEGKDLFLRPPNAGGAGCAGCHQPPTFALVANSRSNGLDAGETTIFKSPSLKNVSVTGPYMHGGTLATLAEVVEHYNSGISDGPALDPRLAPAGVIQQLDLTANEKDALVAFLETLTDNAILADTKFADPFKS